MSVVVLACPGHETLGRRLSELTGTPPGVVTSRRFPDGETYVRIDTDCAGKRVVLACSLDRPDAKLLPLAFLADAARDRGASRVGLVAPYLPYMRQDRRFEAGEAVTSRTFAALLSRQIDWLATVDPHLHRYRSLAEVYSVPTRVVHAAPLLADWVAAEVGRPLVVGPDEESAQWVKEVADRARAPYLVMRKTRRADRVVEVTAPSLDALTSHTPVVVDDIISSAQTMVAVVKALAAGGLRGPICVGVHALFAEGAERALREAGAADVVTTTSVSHATNRIDVAPLLMSAVRELAGD